MAYGYYRTITIDNTKVPGDLTDHPFLFNTTHNDLRTVGNGGHVTSASGYDIVFSPNTDGSAPYAHEIEKYDPATGELVAHVKIPSISSSVDTVFYIVYGDSNVTTSQENIIGVWDSDFKAVWHLREAFLDSTSNDNDGTNHGSDDVVGKISRGRNFVAANLDYIDMGSKASLDDLIPCTYEMWIYWDDVATGVMLGKAPTDQAYGHCVAFTDEMVGVYRQFVDTNLDYKSAASAIAVGTWTYAVFIVKADKTADILINGSEVAYSTEQPGVGNLLSDAAGNLHLGRRPNAAGPLYYDGGLDEVRISGAVRSTDYITATYNNQHSPGTFYALGVEQSGANNIFDSGVGADAVSVSSASGLPDYLNSKSLTVAAATGSGVTAGYSVKYTCSGGDAAEIYDVCLASGNDFRVAYWDGTHSIELDRDLVTFSASSIEVWFKLRAAISGGSTDGNYALYYNYAGAGSPPADKEKVYYLWEDFVGEDIASLEAAGWKKGYNTDLGEVSAPTYAIESNELSIQNDYGYGYTAGLFKYFDLSDYLLELETKIISGRTWSRGGLSFRTQDFTAGNNLPSRFDGNIDQVDDLWSFMGGSGAKVIAYDVWYDLRVHCLGSDFTYFIDDVQIDTANNADYPSGGIGPSHYEFHSHYKNIKVRMLVGTEPTVTVTPGIDISDSGTGVETLVISVTAPLTDTFVGTDLLTAAGIMDTGVGAGALTIAASLSLSDTAVGAESIAITVSLSLSDTAAGAGSVDSARPVPLSDTAAGSESISIAVSLSVTDSGVGSGVAAGAIEITEADTAAGSESITIAVAASVSDSGEGAGTLAMAVVMSLTDTAEGTDSLVDDGDVGVIGRGPQDHIHLDTTSAPTQTYHITKWTPISHRMMVIEHSVHGGTIAHASPDLQYRMWEIEMLLTQSELTILRADLAASHLFYFRAIDHSPGHPSEDIIRVYVMQMPSEEFIDPLLQKARVKLVLVEDPW